MPAPPGTTSGIVVLPAIAGVNDYIRAVERRLQEAGCRTDTVDYFEGGAPPDLSSPQKILAAVDQVDDGRVLQQVRAAVQRLKSAGAAGIGVLGFCIGGSYAVMAGCQVDGLSAAANYYGGLRYPSPSIRKPVAPLEQVPALRVPLISHYGTVDRFVPPDDIAALENTLDAHGRSFELYRYSGAPHAFDEDFRPAYRPAAAREAWLRTMTYLNWYLRAS